MTQIFRKLGRLVTLFIRACCRPAAYWDVALQHYFPPQLRQAYCQGGWKLALRRQLPPICHYPVVVRTQRDRVLLYLSLDPIDERIAMRFQSVTRNPDFASVPVVLPHGPTILDLGAHHGFYAVHALARYAQSKVICVEPNTAAIGFIKRNLKLNRWMDRARIVHAGLAPTSGTGHLRLSAKGSWGDSLFITPEETQAVQEVPLLTLSEILQGERPDIVKCNAEGAEFEFVRQFLAVSWRPALLSIAIHEEFGDGDALVSAMQRAGYQMIKEGEAERPIYHFWADTSFLTLG